MIRCKKEFLYTYLEKAPIALAIERTFECEILSKQKFQRPVLDIGCGDGVFASVLFLDKIDTGLDADVKELKKSQESGMYKELINGFANNISKSNESYATVFSNSVLEHIQDIDAALNEIYRILQSNGTLFVTVPTNLFDHYSIIYQILSGVRWYSLAQHYQKFFNKFWRHYHYYTRNEWITLFEKHNFFTKAVIEYGKKKDCLFNNLMVPLSIPNYLTKKIVNRYFLIPYFRRFYAHLMCKMMKKRIKIDPELKDGGLIFFELIKQSNG
jgi:ubiquinone/menaquinone biosynthesis C-methylase UbiE